MSITVYRLLVAVATQDVKVKEEIDRLAPEYKKLKEPWRFVAK
jgi:hypothetical protein